MATLALLLFTTNAAPARAHSAKGEPSLARVGASAVPAAPPVQIVKVEPSPDEVARAGRAFAADQRILGLGPDTWVAIFTGVLALFTLALAVVSGIQIKYLTKADRRAANASEETARQLALMGLQADISEKQKEIERLQYFAQHRPKILVKEVYFQRGITGDIDTLFYEVANVGGSPATIMTGFVTVDLIPDPALFKGRPPSDLGQGNCQSIGPGQVSSFTISLSDRVRQVVVRRMGSYAVTQEDGIPIYFYGYFNYVDDRGEEFGQTRLSVFRRVWRDGSLTFGRLDNPDWEYAD